VVDLAAADSTVVAVADPTAEAAEAALTAAVVAVPTVVAVITKPNTR